MPVPSQAQQFHMDAEHEGAGDADENDEQADVDRGSVKSPADTALPLPFELTVFILASSLQRPCNSPCERVTSC
jgi:hypothetical protein